MKYPFKDLKVVELASVLAGPAVGMFFAELGAQVIKIENPRTGGDVTRRWKLPMEPEERPWSAYFCSVNWNKKSLFLDLLEEKDRTVAEELICTADIVVSNFLPASAQKMGMEPERLRTLNPRLIIAQLQSFDDPTDERPAFDMVLQAEAGFLYMNGEPDRAPVKMPVALIDLLAGHQLKEAILIALLNRERSGEGAIVRVSLLESALASLANQASNYLNTGFIPQRMGTAHPNIAPYGDIFQGSDGVSLVLAVGTERQFQRLCEVLGKMEWLNLPAFCSNAARVQHREALNAALASCFRVQKATYWISQLEQAGVPVALIRNMESVFQLPAAQAMILEEEMEDGTISKRLRTNAFKIGF